jgi:hypothetical protein
VIIGPDFAPSGLPPATRIRFFAKHLPEFGWEPIILTVDPRFYEWPIDPESERLLQDSLQVVRTDAFSASWTRKLGIGDIGMRSLWHQWRKLKSLSQERKPDLIFIPVPPYVTMALGRLAHNRFRIPYVIDYIDPWVTEYYWKLPRAERPPKWPLAYLLSRLLEPFSLKHVRHIVGVSKGTTDSVRGRYPWLEKTGASEIPYGGEPSDFEYLRKNPRKNKIFDLADGLFHLTYAGAYTPGMKETIRALFDAARAGLDRRPSAFNRLRLHFVGTSYSPLGSGSSVIAAMAQECGIGEMVDEHPARVHYLDALQIMLDSHGLLILGSDEPHYTASKVFPCILARKPLLAVFHEDSSVVSFLMQVPAARLVTFNRQTKPAKKVEEILERLEEIIACSPDARPAVQWDLPERYTARAMTARLAQAFDSALEKG